MESSRYVPPHLRAKRSGEANEDVDNKDLRGTVGLETSSPIRDSGSTTQPTTYTNIHATVQYTRNRNGLYREPSRYGRKDVESDIFDFERSGEGINFDAYDNIPIEVTGDDIEEIKPVATFSDVTSAYSRLNTNVTKMGYSKPTPVQKYAMAIVQHGRDLMACAQTGSGKTAAFLLPGIIRMLTLGAPDINSSVKARPGYRSARLGQAAYPATLILAPTRELAAQIFTESRKFSFGLGMRAAVLSGGVEVRGQLMELDRGCDICIATPGRLNDLIDRKRIKLDLINYLVLDEADRMLDMGFAPQIRTIVERRDMPRSEDGRQTVMFSATFPKEIQLMAKEFLINYIYLVVGRVGSTSDSITQRMVYADEDQKPRRLTMLLREQGAGLTIVFVETKRKADVIEGYLLNENFPAVSIHGDRSQAEREEALKLFKAGVRPFLVATDVAARGLDINNVTHVINCDLPGNIDDYVHRIGRTGRAGHKGLATSFVNNSSKPILKDLLNILEESKQEIPPWFLTLVGNNSYPSRRTYNNKAKPRKDTPPEKKKFFNKSFERGGFQDAW